MRVSKRSIVAVLCLAVLPAVFLYAEGTKQVMPISSSEGQLCINKFRNDFAFYNAPPDFRLNISIANPTETIRYGFGKVIANDTVDLVYRILDPSGTIVYGPFPVPTAGNGFIPTYTQAFRGPFPAVGGYNYLELQPLTAGDYSIEFYYPPVYTDVTQHLLEFFDITVVNAAGSALDGRIWSKAWQFGSEKPRSSTSRFYGKMMILSDDSIVTQVDCNGFSGGTFSFASNRYGCVNTGNLTSDRMSRVGSKTYPQYKVFLNNPDRILFPTQKLTPRIIEPITVTTNCATGGADFGIKVVKDGSIQILIDINPSPETNPEDVQIIADVKADPGGTGYNIITWNGNDNYGNPVPNGTRLGFHITILSGMTHLPLHDVEDNDNGFIIKQIRPAGGQLSIYWDDSKIGGSSNTVIGCMSNSGCHTWNNDFGNNNIVNSWWYLSWARTEGPPFTTKRTPVLLNISGSNVHCLGTTTLRFSVTPDPNSTSYFWSYSGTGVALAQSGDKATLTFAPDATPGILSVYGHNDTCGDGPVTNLNITFETLPTVVLADYPDICYTSAGFLLEGGDPAGGTYFVDGVPADSLFPYKEMQGIHAISYLYTTPTGCSNSDTSKILLRTGSDCLGIIYFPNAFSPDGDSLNDVFRPVVSYFSSFKMYVFTRWGQLIYTTDDVVKGWDGTYLGKDCPEGTYTFMSTYRLSLRPDIFTKRGMFVLIR
jgi:gliding motility-associated-like protein